MIHKDFFSKNHNKLVHIDYIEEDGNSGFKIPAFFDGFLKGCIVSKTDEDDEPIEELIEVETDTDLKLIPKRLIRRIYVKEEE